MENSTISIDARAQVAQNVLVRKVYAWMTMALLTTGLVAYMVAADTSLVQMIVGNMAVFIGLLIAQVVLVMVISAAINKLSFTVAFILFVLYSVLNGLTLSVIFLVYTSSSLTSTFLVTAGTFAAMSLYGYTTKRDLTSIGNIALMALFGVIIASIVNFFLQSSMMYWIITYVGVLVFVALTAYDTQKIKRLATMEDTESGRKLAILGALTLYLDFINLFLLLLRIMGGRK